MNFNKVMIILVFTLFPVLIKAQSNEIKARIEFEEAETAFANNNFNQSFVHLKEAEKLLQKWTPLVSFLKIQCLDKTIDYNKEWTEDLAELYNDVKSYMNYSDKYPEAVVIEKLKVVYEIEKKINYAYDFHFIWGEMPEFVKGESAREKNEYTEAMNWYKKAAEKQNPRAIHSIGNMYYYGWGVEKDDKEAFKWIKKGAELGSYRAMYALAALYNVGEGVEKNFEESISWMKKAAEKGDDYAMNYIGILYYTGQGVQKNLTEAFNWFRKAAEKGNDDAITYTAMMYYNGEGVQQNYAEAMKWYLKSAEKGDANAMYAVGYLHYSGLGVPQDYSEAMQWYLKAADSGNSGAMYIIGLYYKNGIEVKISYAEALSWFIKAFENGEKNSKQEIVEIYNTGGYGVDKDKKLANEWTNKN